MAPTEYIDGASERLYTLLESWLLRTAHSCRQPLVYLTRVNGEQVLREIERCEYDRQCLNEVFAKVACLVLAIVAVWIRFINTSGEHLDHVDEYE